MKNLKLLLYTGMIFFGYSTSYTMDWSYGPRVGIEILKKCRSYLILDEIRQEKAKRGALSDGMMCTIVSIASGHAALYGEELYKDLCYELPTSVSTYLQDLSPQVSYARFLVPFFMAYFAYRNFKKAL